MPHTLFSLERVAAYLHVSQADVELLVRRSEIPFEKQGARLVFRKKDIDAWASQRILGFPQRQLTDYHKATSAKHHDLSASHAIVPELCKADYMVPATPAKTKASIIRHMVDLADQTGLLNYKDDLLTSLQERERMCSTALSGGIALLHPGHHEPYMFEDSFVALARTVQPIPFGSPDGATTDLFFLICCQDDRIHLHVLTRICMLCYHTSVILDLREASDAKGMYAALVRAEEEVVRGL